LGAPKTLQMSGLFCATAIALAQFVGSSAIEPIEKQVETGDLAGALTRVEVELKQHPRDAELYNLRGIIRARTNDLAGARADFTEATTIAPALLPAWRNLGRACQILTGQDTSAAKCSEAAWRRVLQVAPADAEARISLATLLEWRGQFVESMSQLDQVTGDESKRASALALRCANLAGLHRYAEALRVAAVLQAAQDYRGGDFDAIVPVLGDPAAAELVIKLTDPLAHKGELSHEALGRLGSAYEQLGRLTEARSTLEQLARIDPQNPKPLLQLARLSYLLKDREGALGYLAHARDLSPRDAQVHFLFGMISVEMDLPLEARQSLQHALDLEPDNPRYNYVMGSVLLNTRATSDALPYFQKYVQLEPQDPRGHFAMGVALFASGDYEKAKSEMEKIETEPKTAGGASYFLGRIAFLDRNLDEASTKLERSIQLMPSYAESHVQLGRVRLEQHRLEQARTEIERALQLDPDSFQGNAELLVIYRRTRDPRALEQQARLEKLDEQRSAKQELMLRTIEVRPY
jgi:Flp pilus assembly protein TadD